MYALVSLATLTFHEPFQPTKPDSAPEGAEWWPVRPEIPTFDRKREVAVAGDLYADERTKTIRRLYVVREKTSYELAEQRGLQSLKMLSFSDQPMVRALEEVVLLLMEREGITLDDLKPEVAEKFKKRRNWRENLG